MPTQELSRGPKLLRVATRPSGPPGVRFHIQQESDIPASTQLYNQICFAIAARHYPPGHRLPSTRQLAMQTGLHRNTITKRPNGIRKP